MPINTQLALTRNYIISLFQKCVLFCSDSRQALSQREKELVDSADKCRETMENQMTDLRKQCSTLEQEIASAREDNKALQQQLRDKVSNTIKVSS